MHRFNNYIIFFQKIQDVPTQIHSKRKLIMKAKFSSDGKYTIKIISLVLLFIMLFPTFASIAKSVYNPTENADFDSYLNDSIPVIRIDTEDKRPITSKTVYK